MKVLMVTNNAGGADVQYTTPFYNLLTGRLDTVNPLSSTAAVPADIGTYDLVILTYIANEADVGTKYRDVAVPVLAMRSGQWVTPLSMIGTSESNGSGTTITVTNTSHPIAVAVPLGSGSNTLDSASSLISRGTLSELGPDGQSVGWQGLSTYTTLFTYDVGGEMAGGIFAPARRVGFGYADGSKLATLGNNTFLAAVDWAAGSASTPPTAPTSVSATTLVAAPVVSWTTGTGQTSQYVHRVASGASAPTDATTRTSGELSAAATSWTDSTSPADGAYVYYVEALNSAGSTFSASGAAATVAHPPTVTFTSPSATSVTLPAGTKIILEFTATDALDGDLTAQTNVTSSNTADGTSGALGTGSPLTVNTTGWADGVRTITATATDSDTLTGSDSFTLTIGTTTGGFDKARFIIHALGGIA